jgi:hypothetical protein
MDAPFMKVGSCAGFGRRLGRVCGVSRYRQRQTCTGATLSELRIPLPPGSALALAPEQNALVFDWLSS